MGEASGLDFQASGRISASRFPAFEKYLTIIKSPDRDFANRFSLRMLGINRLSD
jgi:hypothetical protein